MKTFYYMVNLEPTVIPQTFTQTNKYPEWREAMQDEFDALLKNQMWELVSYNPNQNVVTCKQGCNQKGDEASPGIGEAAFSQW